MKKFIGLILLLLTLNAWGEVPAHPQTIAEMCAAIDHAAQSLNWKLEPCLKTFWREGGRSVQNRPLIYAEFGDASSKNKTLIFSTVHGDEVTPLYLGMKLAAWLKEFERTAKGRSVHVILAPLLNPDGFFVQPRTRYNARGVDVNRNFQTRDWDSQAIAAWKKKFHSDKRRYPGPSAGSEPETLFQQMLIQKMRPQKIMAIHSPLNFMDYDGPSGISLDRFPKDYVEQCLKLRKRLKATSSGFFPGSLGNYSGQELGIPTLTLELPTANPRKALEYWNHFSNGIRAMIEFEVPPYAPPS